MAHDVIARSSAQATMTAKFDYDAVLHKDLEGERVHAYLHGTGMSQWTYLGSYFTDTDGKIHVSLGARPVRDYVVRFVVEGDLSTTSGYLSAVDPGREAVPFDIDGTLTINDLEAYADYLGIKMATPYYYVPEVVNAYRQKGYQVIYYHSNPYGDGPIPPDTQAFKTEYVRYLCNVVGLNVVRAYGNATTDIVAYADGGILKVETCIIGPNAGASGTQSIYGEYGSHYTFVAAPTPESRPPHAPARRPRDRERCIATDSPPGTAY